MYTLLLEPDQISQTQSMEAIKKRPHKLGKCQEGVAIDYKSKI